ncbi:unnamed protein product [Rhizoctonia solani]|uniref:Uncharacterized protein n=1 Tax=Rhizoctonia solani TaxID=456999 RepID=A0A8H3CNB6_9AGAM|nr:unnamed protein product [Rhizoctonia solani]
MGDSVLLSRLSEHLFDLQMVLGYHVSGGTQIFTVPNKDSNTPQYAPPTLPVHVAVKLEVVSGIPSEKDIIKVQDAIRAYQQFVNDKRRL